jgi:tetratricopeptide (TPR) repeat protein
MSSKAVLLAVLIACVCAAVIAVHWPALPAQALSFDDDQYLVNNTLVKSPSWLSAWKFLSQVLEPSTVGGYYQPLAMISLMFDYSLGGRVENLLPFHRTSLALHAANTALIIVLLYLLFGEVWIAAAAGLLFGLHPMTVEAIPWVGERKTLLAAFFALWSLLFYLRYTHARTVIAVRNVTPAKAGARIQSSVGCSTWGFYIACFLFYLLALMSKPTSTPLPVLMLLLDFWPLKRFKWQSFFEKIPFFILGGIFAVITYISQTRTAGSTLPTETGIWHIPLILCHNIIFYLYKIIWPVNLSSHYSFPDPLNLSQPMVLAGVIGTFILIPLLLISLRWTRAALIGWLFFFIAILPTMGVIGFTNVIASDKFAYLPSFGLLMILASFLCNLRLKNSVISVSKSVVIILLVLISASAEFLATRSYLIHWRNSLGLCEYMVSKVPNAAPLLHYNLGAAYGELGRWEEATEAYKQAIRIKPDYADAHNNLGVAYSKLGRSQEAIEAFSQAIKIKTDYAEAHYNLGTTYGKLGRSQEAIDEYKQTIKIKPDYAEAHFNLGIVYGTLGRYQEAVESYKQAIRIKPDYTENYNLGVNYYKLGRYQDAVEAYKQAIKIKPDFEGAHYNLGVAYLVTGDKESALKEHKILQTLDAEQANKLFNLIYK